MCQNWNPEHHRWYSICELALSRAGHPFGGQLLEWAREDCMQHHQGLSPKWLRKKLADLDIFGFQNSRYICHGEMMTPQMISIQWDNTDHQCKILWVWAGTEWAPGRADTKKPFCSLEFLFKGGGMGVMRSIASSPDGWFQFRCLCLQAVPFPLHIQERQRPDHS